MKKENLAFLVGGFAFGILFGVGLFNAMHNGPRLDGGGEVVERSGPAGPRAPTQIGPSGAEGGAPMMAQINALKRRLQQSPDDVEAILRLAHIYHDVSMWEQAIGYYERALEIKADDPDVMTDLGVCYRGMRQYDRALALFDRAHALDPQHWQSLFNTVIVAGFDLGQFERARAALESMETMDPAPPQLAQLRQALEQRAGQATQG